MTFYSNAGGKPSPKAFIIPDVNPYTIVTAEDSNTFRIESVWVACVTTTSVFKLWIDTGDGVPIYVDPGTSITNGTKQSIIKSSEHPISLNKGWSLKCSSDNGNKLHVTISLAIATAFEGQQGLLQQPGIGTGITSVKRQ